MAMITWTDAHNHLQDARLGATGPVVRAMKRAGIARCVVNATHEADWAAVESLAEAERNFVVPAFGIHPWQAHTARVGWQDRLRELLEKHPEATIGECGLDKWVSNPPIEVQLPVFVTQLRIARETGRPVTIHCLKAWEALFGAFAIESPPPSFLMHSFGGSIEVARRLIPLGAYFSFSGYFLHPRKENVREVFRKIPQERILLETDAPDMLPPPEFIGHSLPDGRNHPANLPEIGSALAAVLEIPVEELAAINRANFQSLFSG